LDRRPDLWSPAPLPDVGFLGERPGSPGDAAEPEAEEEKGDGEGDKDEDERETAHGREE
jgi:hypothetical protein